MKSFINQAVVFTKPLHHLELSLSPVELAEQAELFFEQSGFNIVHKKVVDGSALATREVIRQHYLIYSTASYIESAEQLELSPEARVQFQSAFGKNWNEEIATGRIMGNPSLLKEKELDAHQLFQLWNKKFSEKQAHKIATGLLMAWLSELDCYCINAFYPAMEANFYHPSTDMTYYVVEFDPDQVSWQQFRKNVLGVTNASKAEPESFRGQLYAKYPVEYPGRDNFVHGSAGPLEGLVERAIHESDFDMRTNPVGCYLAEHDLDLNGFKHWKSAQSIAQLGSLFDHTEEINTAQAISILDGIQFQ